MAEQLAVTDRDKAREQLKSLIAQGPADETADESSQEDGGIQSTTAPDVHEATRKLLEQVVELARRPLDVSGMPAPQVSVQPASVHVPAPTVHVEAPSVTVQAPVAAAAIPWTFEFERFPNGTIKAIHATPLHKNS